MIRKSPIVVFLAIVSVVVALSLTNSAKDSSEKVGAVQQKSVLPLWAAIVQSDNVSRTIDRVNQTNFVACMESNGVKVPVVEMIYSAPSDSERLANRYLAPRTNTKGQVGYLLLGASDSERPSSDPVLVSKAYQLAAGGTETLASGVVYSLSGRQIGGYELRNGCLGTSLIKTYGSIEDYSEFVTLQAQASDLAATSYFQLRSNVAFQKLSDSWAKCMRETGFNYSSIFAPSDATWPPPHPSAIEEKTARADLKCRTVAGATPTNLATIEATIQTDLIEQYQFSLGPLSTITKKIIDRNS